MAKRIGTGRMYRVYFMKLGSYLSFLAKNLLCRWIRVLFYIVCLGVCTRFVGMPEQASNPLCWTTRNINPKLSGFRCRQRQYSYS